MPVPDYHSLEQHFDAAFAAPDGIKKLRELILTLAMQGKLVEQDPNDQPASELFKQIEAEKRRLVAAGKIKAPKPLPAVEVDEVPYEVPAGWAWVRLGEFIELVSGQHLLPEEYNEESNGFPYYTGPSDFGKFNPINTRWTRIDRAIAIEGDILLTVKGAGVGKTNVMTEPMAAMGRQLMAIRIIAISKRYVLKFLDTIFYELQGLATGIAIPGIGRDDVLMRRFPLPPLAEQRRIVARIDELMARCDELEAVHAAREQKRVDVHTAALNALLGAQEPAAFAEAWQFLAQHFGDLHSVPRNVAELRKAVLQLAVMGKLVEQDPNDPPASELLEEIQEEKNRLIVAGKIRAPKPLPPVTPEEMPYPVPAGWEWVRLNAITSKITDGDHQTPKRIDQGKRLFSAKNVRDGFLDFSNFDQISEKDYEKSRERCLPEEGDLLIVSVGGTIGRSSLVPADSNFALVRSVALIKPLVILPRYLKISMDSDLLQTTIREKKRGGAQPCLYLSEIESFPIPLPSLTEQRRIVAKIDQLMALCDQLEAGLAAQTSRQSALLASVIAAVTPASAAPTRRAAPARAPAAALAGETVHRGPGRPRKEAAARASAEGEAVTVRRGPGRPRKNQAEPAYSIPEATSEADAIRRLEALKIERARGSRQVGLFESET